MLYQDGLEWVEETFGGEPRWTKEPDIDIMMRIVRSHLRFDEEIPADIHFYAQGGFNKLYKVSSPDAEYMMRVSLPVDPRHKTESEVATIEFVRKETDMPIPRIIAFDSDNSNELGFEWILMEMVPGTTLWKIWRKMAWAAKEDIIKQLAKYQSQLFLKRFDKIGNIFHRHGATQNMEIGLSNGDKSGDKEVIIGAIVSLVFFWGDHLTHDVPRGPFGTSLEWLQARLALVVEDQRRIIAATDDEDDIQDAKDNQDLAAELAQILPTVFAPGPDAREPTVIFHDDLSMHNVMVDTAGKLTAVIDWECVSAVPLWSACRFPHLLEGRHRDEKPERDNYMSAEEDAREPSELDNEGANEMYWEHLLEFERTQLRGVFVSEMEARSPEWVAVMRESGLKIDFDKAVHSFDGMAFRIVKQWLDAYKEGKVECLAEQLSI